MSPEQSSLFAEPAAPAPERRPWPSARWHYSEADNGLVQPWRGRVWLNPPYGNETVRWMRRLVAHGDGVALIFARTETGTFFETVYPHASALLFLRGRLCFRNVDGSRPRFNAGAPSVLVAYGERNAESLASCGLPGALVRLAPGVCTVLP